MTKYAHDPGVGLGTSGGAIGSASGCRSEIVRTNRPVDGAKVHGPGEGTITGPELKRLDTKATLPSEGAGP